VADAESELEKLAARLADALGTVQIPETEPMSLAELVERQEIGVGSQETGDRSQESGDSGLMVAQVAPLLAGSGAAGDVSEGAASTGDSAAEVEQLLAGSGATGGASEEAASTGDSAAAVTAAEVEQLLGGSGTAGGASEGTASTGDTTAALTAAVEQLRSVEQVQADAAGQNTEAMQSGTSSPSSGGSSAFDAVGSAAASVFESGLGLAPLISGLVSLFGGSGGATTPPALSTYTAPESVQFEGDVYRGANVTDWGGSGGTQSGAPLPANQQITVQVNALDSQSFLDHSQDIASAVRQAMLNSNSLNDVVNDL
jgi:hypothetical protein